MYHTCGWQNIFTTSTGIHYQQQQDLPSTTLECNYCCCNVLYFNFTMYLTLYSCNHIVLMKLWFMSLASQMGIYSLPVTRNLIWHSLMKLHFSRCHTFQHYLVSFELKKHAFCLNLAIKINQQGWNWTQALRCTPQLISL